MTFDLEDEGAAYAELDARWETGEGARFGVRRSRDAALALERRDWGAWTAMFTPDVVGRDHRIAGFGDMRGPDVMLRRIQAMLALAPDARMRTNHVRACENGMISDVAWSGTRDGRAFESPFVTVSELDAEGRCVRIDFYDAQQADRALARFEEIRANERHDPLAAVPLRNAATEAMERIWSTFDTVDPEAAAAAFEAVRADFAPGFVWEDRRPIVGITGDLDLMFASARERIAMGARHERRTVLGTAGDRIAIARVLWAGGPPGGRFEVEFLALHELDAAGLCTSLVFFEPDATRAAQHEARARWAAIDPVAAPWVALLNEITDSWNAHDAARIRAGLQDDFVVEDHRLAGIGRLEGTDAYVDSVTALWELAPDQRIEFGRCCAIAPGGALFVLRRTGTIDGGGMFENEHAWLALTRDGRIARLELFEIEHLDAALARFEALRPRALRRLATR